MLFDDVVRWVHLMAAAVWVGGLITLGALVGAVRSAGADRTVLRAMAQRFGVLSWTALGVAVASGIVQASRSGVSLQDDRSYAIAFLLKLGLVGIAAGLALVHQMTARTATPAARGIVQALILAASLGIMAAAVAL